MYLAVAKNGVYLVVAKNGVYLVVAKNGVYLVVAKNGVYLVVACFCVRIEYATSSKKSHQLFWYSLTSFDKRCFRVGFVTFARPIHLSGDDRHLSLIS